MTLSPPKTMSSLDLSDSLKALAGVIRAGIDGAPSGRRIDLGLATFACVRHRVGPLMHIAASRGLAPVDDDAAALLSSEWERNKRRCVFNQLTSLKVQTALGDAGIASLTFKGPGLAVLLYPAPEWRHAGDIDVLVGPHDLAAAAGALRAKHFTTYDSVLALPAALERVAMRVVRDILFGDISTGQKIELHSRLIFSTSVSERIQEADISFRLPRPPQRDAMAAKGAGAGLLCYLLAHGAISGWSRLKWLIDIYAVLRDIDPSQRPVLISIADRCGVSLAVRAGLMVARDVFPEIDLASLETWVYEPTGLRRARRRAERYIAWLDTPSNDAPNPLHDRRAALAAQLLLHDRMLPKLVTLTHGGLSSGLRLLGKALGKDAGDAPPGPN